MTRLRARGFPVLPGDADSPRNSVAEHQQAAGSSGRGYSMHMRQDRRCCARGRHSGSQQMVRRGQGGAGSGQKRKPHGEGIAVRFAVGRGDGRVRRARVLADRQRGSADVRRRSEARFRVWRSSLGVGPRAGVAAIPAVGWVRFVCDS